MRNREEEDVREELQHYMDRARRLEGWAWDIEPTLVGASQPWNFREMARQLVSNYQTVLDIGTGGGEAFVDICKGYNIFAVATEAWKINAPVAAKRLAQIEARVVQANSHLLSFADASFDVILARHESFDPSEIVRVLSPRGHFLTQQVGRSNWSELRPFFPRMTDFGPNYELFQDGFRSLGLEIIQAETHDTYVSFANLGEVAYALTATPWTIPDFELERDLDALLDFGKQLIGPEGIVLTESRYIIEACKPN